MTTEIVSVLFTDVVGSTELSHHLSVEAADEVRRGHFSLLRQAVAEAGGTEVKNLGDGLMVVFASASAALACGVAMQQAVDQGNRDGTHPVGLRVGLSGGEVTREEDDYFGDPVVEAARLCARCDPGQVLATDIVRGMAGRRNRHVCRSVGELELKGLPHPVAAVEVLWEPLGAPAGTVPLPGRLSTLPAVGVVGRGDETAAIAAAVDRVAAGGPREVVLVSGEAGLGKTTLVGEAARAAFGGGACVLFGHCEEELAVPYQLFVEALGHYVTHAPEEELRQHVEVYGSELSRLVPALAGRIPDLPPCAAADSDTERYLLFAAVVGLLAAASAVRPVVMVLDDLQWADNGSLLLLRHLAGSEQSLRLVVLGTYRDSELSRSHSLTDLLGTLHRGRGLSHLELAGLDDAAVVSFLESAAGHPLDDALVGLARAIHKETDGNPFFVGELLRHLLDTGEISPDVDGRWVHDHGPGLTSLPESVRIVIGSRAGRLGTEAERILSMASVIGNDFDIELLSRVTTTDEDGLLDILEAAATVALVREPIEASGRYTFAHALIQRTLYEDLGTNRRARAHRQVALALEDLTSGRPGARVAELSRHWVNATGPASTAKAIQYSRLAGDAALASLAPADALHHYSVALDLLGRSGAPDPLTEVDLTIGLGTAQRLTGDPGSRDTLLAASAQAAAIGDVDRLATAALANNRGWTTSVGSVDQEKVEFLELAVDRLPVDHRDRARILATLCSETYFGTTLERRQQLAGEALELAHATGEDEVIVWVQNHIFDPLFVPPLLHERVAQSRDTVARAERMGDPLALDLAATYAVMAAGASGDIAGVDHYLAVEQSIVDRIEEPTVRWRVTFLQAGRALMVGDPDRAEQLAVEALEHGIAAGQPDAAVVFGGQVASASHLRGELGTFAPMIDESLADTPLFPLMKASLALAYLESDDTDGAGRLLDEFAASGFELSMDLFWLATMTTYAQVAVARGDVACAAHLRGQLAPYADQWGFWGAGSNGPVSTHLGGLSGALGEYDVAASYFTRGGELAERVGSRFELVRSLIGWGAMLAGRPGEPDVDGARALLTRAAGIAGSHGYGGMRRRADRSLALLA